MKILVASDAHGNEELMLQLVKEYPKMDLYLDAGDSQSSRYNIPMYYSVRGNCDYFPFDEKLRIPTEAGYIFMRHAPIIYPNEEMGIKIFIHGHTHRYKIEKQKNYVVFCPGSLSRSRDNSNGSFGIISIENGQINIDVIDVFTKNVLIHYQIM